MERDGSGPSRLSAEDRLHEGGVFFEVGAEDGHVLRPEGGVPLEKRQEAVLQGLHLPQPAGTRVEGQGVVGPFPRRGEPVPEDVRLETGKEASAFGRSKDLFHLLQGPFVAEDPGELLVYASQGIQKGVARRLAAGFFSLQERWRGEGQVEADLHQAGEGLEKLHEKGRQCAHAEEGDPARNSGRRGILPDRQPLQEEGHPPGRMVFSVTDREGTPEPGLPIPLLGALLPGEEQFRPVDHVLVEGVGEPAGELEALEAPGIPLQVGSRLPGGFLCQNIENGPCQGVPPPGLRFGQGLPEKGVHHAFQEVPREGKGRVRPDSQPFGQFPGDPFLHPRSGNDDHLRVQGVPHRMGDHARQVLQEVFQPVPRYDLHGSPFPPLSRNPPPGRPCATPRRPCRPGAPDRRGRPGIHRTRPYGSARGGPSSPGPP